jgi:hypothetical protein
MAWNSSYPSLTINRLSLAFFLGHTITNRFVVLQVKILVRIILMALARRIGLTIGSWRWVPLTKRLLWHVPRRQSIYLPFRRSTLNYLKRWQIGGTSPIFFSSITTSPLRLGDICALYYAPRTTRKSKAAGSEWLVFTSLLTSRRHSRWRPDVLRSSVLETTGSFVLLVIPYRILRQCKLFNHPFSAVEANRLTLTTLSPKIIVVRIMDYNKFEKAMERAGKALFLNKDTERCMKIMQVIINKFDPQR